MNHWTHNYCEEENDLFFEAAFTLINILIVYILSVNKAIYKRFYLYTKT